MPVADQLGVSDVLEVVTKVFRIEGDLHGDEYSFLCPSHNDTSPSADVNVVTGLWSCFSCGAKGDLAGLGVAVLKVSRDEVLNALKPGTPEARMTAVKRKLAHARSVHSPVPRGPQNVRLPLPRQYEGGPLTYMRNRGFTRATLRQYGVRFVPEDTLVRLEGEKEKEFSIENSIGIPIRNLSGNLVAWCYRATEASRAWQPRYLYTPGFDLSGNWFGLHLHRDLSEIHVCEGPLDAMWLTQNGFPALAMMGSNHRNPRKFRLLERFTKVIVVPDYDDGGVFMAHRLGLILRGRVPVMVARWPKGVVRRTGKDAPDPQDVRRKRDLELVVSRAIPWQAWCMRNEMPIRGE